MIANQLQLFAFASTLKEHRVIQPVFPIANIKNASRWYVSTINYQIRYKPSFMLLVVKWERMVMVDHLPIMFSEVRQTTEREYSAQSDEMYELIEFLKEPDMSGPHWLCS